MSYTVYVSDVIDASVEEVWHVMRDFDDMPSYHPEIMESSIEGGRPSDQVGCTRHLILREGFVREQLTCLDDLNFAFAYKIVEGSIPVRGYEAGVRLRRITEGDRAFCEWWANFEVIDPEPDALIALIRDNIFRAGFHAVAAKLSGVNRSAG